MRSSATEPAPGSALGAHGELTEHQVLDRVSECAVTWQRMGAEMLALAYEWAVAHPADRLDPTESAKPGRERAKLCGGEGTPPVTEFAAATFGARMGRGTHAGRRHIAAALDLRLRLPLLWSRVQALEVRDTYAIHVAEATRNLSPAEAAWVDGEVADQADGRIPWTRFQTLVAGKVTAAAPHLAREREERTARARFAKKLTPLPGDQPAGMASFMVRAPAPVIDALDDAVTTLAHRLAATLPASLTESEDGPTTDDLRVQAVAVLATGHPARTTRAAHAPQPADAATTTPAPTDPPEGLSVLDVTGLDLTGLDLEELDLRDLLPATCLVVHLYGGTATTPAGRDLDTDGVEIDRIARVEGYGPVTETWLRKVLGPFSRFEVLPVLDIDGLAPVDAYEVPARHRRAVQLRHPVETFPFGHATSTRSHTQVDHEIPWSRQPGGGTTTVENLTPLSTFHHRLKTHGGWEVREPFPGIHLWRDPHGGIHLRDATGTRTLPTTPDSTTTPDTPSRRRAVVVELYPGPTLHLAGDLAQAHWSSAA